MYKKLLIIVMLLLLILIAGCNIQKKDSGKTIVAVTIVPEETFVRKVCGDLVDVVVLVPPGSSPETYEPKVKDISRFHDSSIYFAIGVQTEDANIFPVAGDIKTIKLHEKVRDVYPDLTFEGEGRDPHIWLSPKRVKVMIDVIADEMAKLDPENAETYKENAKKYIDELDELDSEITEILKNVQNRKFIAFHPAFGYFADDYGFTMYALEEEGKEATPKHLEEMIELAKKENIKAIFYQSEVDSNQSKAFAEEIGGKTIMLSPLASNYIGNLKEMATTIKEASNG